MQESTHAKARPILNGRVNFPVCLAPMVGLTHVAARLMIREYLPQDAVTIWPTEMLNSRRVPSENFKITPEVMRSPIETDLVPQILGNEEEPISKTAERLEHEWGASGIDINMGCPVKKALSHNYGVALMGDPVYAAEVVRMTVKSTKLPVSVKLRAGHQNDIRFLLDFVMRLQDAGASWITLHPRTAEMKRRGAADWEQIRLVREHLQIPVLGNGDIQVADDIFAMLDQTGCDSVMIGRALTARPWLLWQMGERLGMEAPAGRSGERAPQTPEEEGLEYGRSLRRLFELMMEAFTPDLAMRKFRFFVKTGSPWLLFGHDLYARTMKSKAPDEMREALAKFFGGANVIGAFDVQTNVQTNVENHISTSAHEMTGRTDLRQ